MASSRSRWITTAAGRTSTSSRSPTTWPSSSTNRPSSLSRPVTTRARVGLLHYTSPPIIGGVETILHEQAVRLAARGYRVTILSGRGGPLPEPHAAKLALVPELDSRAATASAARAAPDRG